MEMEAKGGKRSAAVEERWSNGGKSGRRQMR